MACQDSISRIFDELIMRFPQLEQTKKDIIAGYGILERCFTSGNRLYVCGNGGSAADALHIVGELMKSFLMGRPMDEHTRGELHRMYPGDDFSALEGALPAFALVGNSALCTAYANDKDSDFVYAQQIYGYGKQGDTLLCISTSGNAANVVNAAKVANAMGIATLGLTGRTGGMLGRICLFTIAVPECETFKIQELHLPVYHALCAALEAHFFCG